VSRISYLTIADLVLGSRPAKSHKGENGKLLVVGGSDDYVGCLALAGLAALRAGVDIVTVAAPKKVAWAINCISPDLITKKFNCTDFSVKDASQVIKLSKDFDAVLIGNGMREKSDSFVQKVCKGIKKPIVLDAQAVRSVSMKDLDNCMLTPHKKEFDIFVKNSRINKEKVQKHLRTNVLLLKGKVDKIFSRDKIKLNQTGNEGMTKGGTGDVLAGLCAGFLAQGVPLFDAACNGAYINGLVGDRLKKSKGYAFIASDIVEDIKKVVKKLREMD